MFLKNRNISSKIKRSKVTDYAALKVNLSSIVVSRECSGTVVECLTRDRGVAG